METPRKLDWKHILFILGIIGPGIIAAIADNDAGGIATYSVAGANFGLTMLWTLIPITILLIIVQEMVARLGAVTGKGLSDLIRENFKVKSPFFTVLDAEMLSDELVPPRETSRSTNPLTSFPFSSMLACCAFVIALKTPIPKPLLVLPLILLAFNSLVSTGFFPTVSPGCN